MQTFVPYGSDFFANAQCLDRQRLGKQRVETLQIINALTDARYGWQSHPAGKMWQGYVPALALYNKYICEEWIRRGYKDTILERMHPYTNGVSPIYLPEWLEDPAVAASHRSNLLRKDYTHYCQFGWQEPDDLPYVWPV
jgi:hypothetical protein